MRAPMAVSAGALGQVTPTSENTPRQRGVLGAQIAVANRDSEPSSTQSQASDELGAREFEDLQRRFEALGYALHPLHDDRVLVCRWGLAKVIVGIGAARRFLSLVGGKP